MKKADPHKTKPGHDDWLGLLARAHQGRVEVANLTGLRDAEERSISALDILDGRMEAPGMKLAISRLWTRFHLDTGNLAAALERARKLVGLARESGGEELAKALCWQAMIHRERSEHERAVELYSEAEPLMANRLSLAELWQEKGLTHTYLEQFDRAEQLLTRALEFFRPYGSAEKTATACNDLGVCHYQRKDYPRSLAMFDEALSLYLKIGYKLGCATTAGNLVNLYLHIGDIHKAKVQAANCLEWGTEAEDWITIGLGHEKLGTIYQVLGMPEVALEHLEKAEECAAMTGDFMVRGLVLGLRAEALAGLGRTGEAEAALARAEELGRETGDEILVRRMEVKRAWLASRLGDHARAAEKWDELIGKAEGAADRKSAGEARLEKAACLLALGEAVPARRCFEEIVPGDDYSVFWLLRHRALGAEIGRATEDERMTHEHCSRARMLAGRLLEANHEPWIRDRLLSADPLMKLSVLGCL